MAAFSAKNARVKINGTFYKAMKWAVKVKVDEVDISNFETGGYADYTSGLLEAEISVEGFYDSGNPPYPNLTPGSILSNVLLYVDFVNIPGSFWSFPSVLVFDTDNDAEARGTVKFSFRGKNKGTFSFPS
jgi:hypothetical protein